MDWLYRTFDPVTKIGPDVPIITMCIWTYVDDVYDGYWESGCRGALTSWTPDGSGPLQWGWRFCPFCRSPIAQRRPGNV